MNTQATRVGLYIDRDFKVVCIIDIISIITLQNCSFIIATAYLFALSVRLFLGS